MVHLDDLPVHQALDLSRIDQPVARVRLPLRVVLAEHRVRGLRAALGVRTGRCLPARQGGLVSGVVVGDAKEDPARCVRHERGCRGPVDTSDLRDVLPDEDRRAVGAQQAGILLEHIKPAKHRNFIEKQHGLVLRPSSAFGADDRRQDAACHDAQPDVVNLELVLVDAEINRHRLVAGEVVE